MLPYEFTTDWFQGPKGNWDQLIPQIKPTKILEIGSFEGAATCYLIEKLADTQKIEIHCIDTWEGGIDHELPGISKESVMRAVETRFFRNTQLALNNCGNSAELVVHKGSSDMELSKLISSGKGNYFDFIYVDGSHQAPDVLCDAVLSFKLLKIGGVIAFDDYLWNEKLPQGVDPIRSPKIAIDSFTTIYCRKVDVIPAPLNQLYVQKKAN